MSLANLMLGALRFVLIEFKVLYLNLLKWQRQTIEMLEWESGGALANLLLRENESTSAFV